MYTVHSLGFVHTLCVYVHVCIFLAVKLSALSLSSGLSPLHLAVLRDRKDLARMLLDAGADINAMVSSCAALTQH